MQVDVSAQNSKFVHVDTYVSLTLDCVHDAIPFAIFIGWSVSAGTECHYRIDKLSTVLQVV